MMRVRISCLAMVLFAAMAVQPGMAQSSRLPTSNRPGDVLRNLPGVYTSSLDRYHVQLHGRGLGGVVSGTPLVYLDGLPLESGVLGHLDWNALPASTGRWRGVAWDPAWSMQGDRSLSDGSVRIETVRPDGWRVQASISVLNETGDPGPDRFRPLASVEPGRGPDTNVDRSGPASEVLVSHGGPRLYSEAGYRFDEHHMTDPWIVDRVWTTYNGNDRPRVQVHAPWIRFLSTSQTWTVQAVAHARFQRDFRFLDALSREWATEETAFSGVLQVARSVQSAGQIGLRVSGHETRLDSRPLRVVPPAAMTFREARTSLWFSACRQDRCFQAEAGGYAIQVLQPGIALTPQTITAVGQLSYSAPAVSVTGRFWMEVVGRRPSLAATAPHSGAGSVVWHAVRTGRATLELRATAFSKRPDPGTSFLDLYRLGVTMAGYLPFGFEGPSFDEPGYSTREQMAELVADADFRMASGWKIGLDAGVRHTEGATLSLLSNPDLEKRSPYYRDTRVHVGASGQMLTAGANISRDLPNDGTFGAWARAHRRISDGSVVWWLGMEGLAPYMLGVEGARALWPRVRLYGSARALSPRRAYQLSNMSSYRRPWTVRTELSVVKALAGPYGEAVVSLLNVPDIPLLEQPRGVHEQLALRILVRLSI